MVSKVSDIELLTEPFLSELLTRHMISCIGGFLCHLLQILVCFQFLLRGAIKNIFTKNGFRSNVAKWSKPLG